MRTSLLLQRVSNQLTRLITTKYGSSIGIYPLVEYPKCGGTWVCRMLADSLGLPFAQYSRLPVAMPSVTHGHWKYHPSIQNATYLMRDGRDVMVSFYFHFNRQSDNPNESMKSAYVNQLRGLLGSDADLSDIRTHLPRFIEHIFANPLGARQNWRDHNLAWINRTGVSYVKYEDLRQNCVSAMRQLVSSLGQEPDEETIQQAVQRFSMKQMTGRKPGEEDKVSFIRKGIVGDWKNHFTTESAQVFNDLAGDMLIELAYEPDNSWISRCGDSGDES